MSSTRLVPEQVLLLEQASLKAPLEALRKTQKQTQKTYEYNLQPASTLQKDLDALLRKVAATPPNSDAALDPAARAEMLKSVDGMLSRMRGLKRKLADLEKQSDRNIRVVQTRLDHLAALPASMDTPEYAAWARKRLSHHLVDYFHRTSPPLKQTAMALAEEEGIADLVDDELWDEMAKVERGLDEQSLDEILSWVGENRTALKKTKSPLEFTIHLQAYIELCRARDPVGAIAYARKHLSPATAVEATPEGETPAGTVSPMEQLSRAMALLAYPPDTTCPAYREMYSPARWSTLRNLFRTTFFALHALPSVPLLHISLQAGIASLKTPICVPVPQGAPTAPPSAYPLGGPPLRTTITPDGEIVLTAPEGPSPPSTGAPPTPSPAAGTGGAAPSTGISSPAAAAAAAAAPPIHTLEGRPSRECPLCSSPLCKLGAEVPYSHHVNSTIVCGITGKVVEGDGGEGGQLVALVSRATGEGRVYSKEGLVLRASQHPSGKIVEPVTGEVFEWDELKKVFIS